MTYLRSTSVTIISVFFIVKIVIFYVPWLTRRRSLLIRLILPPIRTCSHWLSTRDTLHHVPTVLRRAPKNLQVFIEGTRTLYGLQAIVKGHFSLTKTDPIPCKVIGLDDPTLEFPCSP